MKYLQAKFDTQVKRKNFTVITITVFTTNIWMSKYIQDSIAIKTKTEVYTYLVLPAKIFSVSPMGCIQERRFVPVNCSSHGYHK